MTTHTAPSTLLADAAAAIAARGLQRQKFCADEVDSDASLCLVGAINVASGARPWDLTAAAARGAVGAYAAVANHLGLLHDDELDAPDPHLLIDRLSVWADAAASDAEVIAVLRAA